MADAIFGWVVASTIHVLCFLAVAVGLAMWLLRIERSPKRAARFTYYRCGGR